MTEDEWAHHNPVKHQKMRAPELASALALAGITIMILAGGGVVYTVIRWFLP